MIYSKLSLYIFFIFWTWFITITMPVNLWDFYVGILPWILESRPDSATRYCSYRGVQLIRTMKFAEKSSELAKSSELHASGLAKHPCSINFSSNHSNLVRFCIIVDFLATACVDKQCTGNKGKCTRDPADVDVRTKSKSNIQTHIYIHSILIIDQTFALEIGSVTVCHTKLNLYRSLN